MSTPQNILVNLPPTFFTDQRLAKHRQRLDQSGEVRIRSHNTLDEIMPDLPASEAIFMWAWPVLKQEHLQQAPRLRFMGQINTTKTTVKACLSLGIALSEVRACWSPAVAEMALALALAGLRRTSEYHCAMRSGQESWVNQFPADIDGRERQLTGRTVGIVGFGGIGQRLAELLQPFNVRLQVYDPFIPEAAIQAKNAQRTDLDVLISSSEVIVLCATNHESARGMINCTRIMAMPKDAVLVNVGRSMLVDMPALQERLTKGDLIAMLDVFDREPLEVDSPFRSLPNTYLTPHRAGGLIESVDRALTWLIDDFEAYLAGKPLRFGVTEAMLPSFPEG